MAAYSGGRSKVFGVSGKDRSAVAMAGHTGKALTIFAREQNAYYQVESRRWKPTSLYSPFQTEPKSSRPYP